MELTEDAGPEESEITAGVLEANGISVNGISMNGISMNGISVNGISMNGVSVAGTQLKGTKSTGGTLIGAGMVGATLKGQLTSGGQIDLHIDSSVMLAAPNADIRTYTITYATTTGAKPLCVGTGGNQAILFPGSWNLVSVRHQADSNMFSVGCRGATFAKCAELGYKADNQLDSYHQACIRALRADYCGDGTAHTVTGTQINVFDKLAIQVDTQAWSVESNWTSSGAICIGKGRIATSLVEPNVPACMASRATVPCVTSSWPGGVLLRTEVNK